MDTGGLKGGGAKDRGCEMGPGGSSDTLVAVKDGGVGIWLVLDWVGVNWGGWGVDRVRGESGECSGA